MGITNNVIVKAAVDALTTLLNVVNKLTGAFGDGAGAILKFVTAAAAIGGMRSFFSGGGLGARIIGGLVNNNSPELKRIKMALKHFVMESCEAHPISLGLIPFLSPPLPLSLSIQSLLPLFTL